MKFKLEQKAEEAGVLKLYLYDEVASDGYNFWTGETVESETSANHFREELAKYPNVQTIELHINSMGGSVREGYGIYAQLKAHPARKVVYVDGFACSIASVIAMAGDEVRMFRNSMMCIHNMMDGCYGNAADHRKCAEDLDKIMEGNRQIYLAKATNGLTEERLTEMLDAETWLTAEECKAMGWCSEIVDGEADAAAVQAARDQREQMLRSQADHLKALSQLAGEKVQKTEVPPPAAPVENTPRKLFSALFHNPND